MNEFVNKVQNFCTFGTIIGLICLGILIGIPTTKQSTNQQYKVVVHNADGSINAIYQTDSYFSSGPSISFVDEYKGKIEIFNCPTIITSFEKKRNDSFRNFRADEVDWLEGQDK